MEPHDSIALIGHNPGDDKNNIYIATGDSGLIFLLLVLYTTILQRH
jgi:hypothetical protein